MSEGHETTNETDICNFMLEEFQWSRVLVGLVAFMDPHALHRAILAQGRSRLRVVLRPSAYERCSKADDRKVASGSLSIGHLRPPLCPPQGGLGIASSFESALPRAEDLVMSWHVDAKAFEEFVAALARWAGACGPQVGQVAAMTHEGVRETWL